MVEITYQMVLSTLQTAGLLVGIYYYIMTLRNQQKNREHSEETRKIQLLLRMNENISERSGSGVDYSEIMAMQWDNYDDFMSKYGVENNPDSYRKRMRIWRQMNVNGLLVRDGLIDARAMIDYIGYGPLWMWMKFKDIIEETRRRYDSPQQLIGFEYHAGELEKYRLSQGLET
jgi:hypothetical protein